LYFAYQDPRMPGLARVVAAGVIGYAFSPIDLIPDPIPILGYPDDLVLLPWGVALAVKLIPAPIWTDAQTQATRALHPGKPTNWIAAAVIVALWITWQLPALYWYRGGPDPRTINQGSTNISRVNDARGRWNECVDNVGKQPYSVLLTASLLHRAP
jgi:uncharacterized membrane protein YkvA (DUF1232 family)